MNEVDFLRGIEGEEQQGSDLVAGAEHLVRLKIQAGQQTQQQYPDLELEKKAEVLNLHKLRQRRAEMEKDACPSCGKIKTACMCGSKYAHEIRPSDRTDIPKGDFAQPGKEEAGHKGKYPIPDRQHARSALGFAKMHHDSGALAAVEKKVEQKYPDMLHGEHEKDASLAKILDKARLQEQEKRASAFNSAKETLKAALRSNPTARAALIGGVVGAVPNAAMGAATAPPGYRGREALRMGLTGGMIGATGGALYHHMNSKLASHPEWNKSMLAATTGLGALAGGLGTYLANRPQKDTGKGKAEEELEAMVNAQKQIPERGFVDKMKRREVENSHGIAKIFREHPVKGSLLGALMGGGAGYGIGQLAGAHLDLKNLFRGAKK